MEEVKFTHYWVTGKGWEVTIYQPSDFVEVEEMGYNPEDGIIFIGVSERGSQHILKGSYEKVTY